MRRARLFLDTWAMMAAHMTGRRETIMALYLNRFGYTAEAWQGLLANPEDRREVLAAMAEAGGQTAWVLVCYLSPAGILNFESSCGVCDS
jgi:hypothetical protein